MKLKNNKTQKSYEVPKEQYDKWPKEQKSKFTVVSQEDEKKQTVTNEKKDGKGKQGSDAGTASENNGEGK